MVESQTPWCHISTDRLQPELSTGSEEEMRRRIRDLYDEHEEYSTVSKSCCYRNLSCRHSVGMVIEQNPRSTQPLDFYMSVFWNLIRGKDLSDEITNMK
jgi:hypothetical protein